MMRFNCSLIIITLLVACSHSQGKYLPEATVLRIIDKKYDSLRTGIKDRLAAGISNVNDYDNVFKPEEKARLDSLIKEFKRQTKLRVVVFTFDSLMISKDSVHEVTQLIGIKNQINVTIGISVPFRDMYIWNDSLVNNSVLDVYETMTIIEENFFPSFRTEAYFSGTFDGLKAIIQRINNNRKEKSIYKNGS